MRTAKFKEKLKFDFEFSFNFYIPIFEFSPNESNVHTYINNYAHQYQLSCQTLSIPVRS